MGGGTDNNQHKIGSEDMVAVATAMETAAAGAATTAVGAPTTAPGIGGADGIAFATTAGTEMTAVGLAKSAASAARTAWCFWRGVAHIVQYLPPLLEEVHAPHSQSEAEEEEAMMGGLWVLVVTVSCVWGAVGCACWLCVCCKPLLFCQDHTHKCTKKLANHGILGTARKLSMRQTKLLHFIKAIL
jgi:hypothetical protein